MADIDNRKTRPSSVLSTSSRQSVDSEIKRETSSGLPTPCQSRMSEYSDMSTTSDRPFSPPDDYVRPAETMVPGYPALGYPDIGYPTRALYPSGTFPETSYPKSKLPPSPYPSFSHPKSPYPSSPLPDLSHPGSPYPELNYPNSEYKPVSAGSDTTSLVFSEDLGVSRSSSDVMYPMSTFPESEGLPPHVDNTKKVVYLP